jgi:hypothetical protein
MRRLCDHCLVGLLCCGVLAVVGCGGADEPVAEGRDAPPSEGMLASALTRAGEPTGSSATAPQSGAWALSWIAETRPVTTTDERTHLVLELIAQNVSDAPQRINALEVFEPGRPRPLARLEGDALAESMAGPDPLTGTIEPGAGALVFLDLTLRLHERLPRELHAVLHTDAGELSTSPAAAVVRERPVRIAPPLRGADLVDLNGCCRGEHGRSLLGNDQGVFVAQRYAIDFLRAPGTRSFEGDPSDNASYFIYGDDVLAVAPGRIVAVLDGVPDNDPTQPLPEFDPESATGNYVVEELGDGRFALYAHLQPGSVRVQPGQRVRRGQVLGLVGNTGNSDEPHLHFHVMDSPSPLFSNGLPYVFDGFRLQGHLDVSGPEPLVVPTRGSEQRQNRLPLDLDIVAFDRGI